MSGLFCKFSESRNKMYNETKNPVCRGLKFFSYMKLNKRESDETVHQWVTIPYRCGSKE